MKCDENRACSLLFSLGLALSVPPAALAQSAPHKSAQKSLKSLPEVTEKADKRTKKIRKRLRQGSGSFTPKPAELWPNAPCYLSSLGAVGLNLGPLLARLLHRPATALPFIDFYNWRVLR